MARLVNSSEYSSNEYDLSDEVWFKPPYYDNYVQGEVVRVYNARYDYHVEYGGSRYSVTLPEMFRNNPDEE